MFFSLNKKNFCQKHFLKILIVNSRQKKISANTKQLLKIDCMRILHSISQFKQVSVKI